MYRPILFINLQYQWLRLGGFRSISLTTKWRIINTRITDFRGFPRKSAKCGCPTAALLRSVHGMTPAVRSALSHGTNNSEFWHHFCNISAQNEHLSACSHRILRASLSSEMVERGIYTMNRVDAGIKIFDLHNTGVQCVKDLIPAHYGHRLLKGI